ncbi:MAG: hypothetical protein ACLT98_10275 [Eggerthellaceae bacterium]
MSADEARGFRAPRAFALMLRRRMRPGPEQVKDAVGVYGDARCGRGGRGVRARRHAFLGEAFGAGKKRCFSPPTFRPMLRRSPTSPDTDHNITGA